MTKQSPNNSPQNAPAENIGQLGTELPNPRTENIDALSTLEMVELINREDRAVITAVEKATPQIAKAIDAIVEHLKKGGRLVYIGAGTSGRLGILDASECLPTFGVGEEAVVGIIAGGDSALRHPVEAAEDSKEAIIEDLKRIHFNKNDILCAIASSGRTPYCIGGLEYANMLGAGTISLACVENSLVGELADFPIEAVVGQEVITGSTRMKSGSAQKMVLNMLSTGSMIKLGKVFGNLMVDVRATNEKLVERTRQMLMRATGCSYAAAISLLEQSNHHVKTAIVMHFTGKDVAGATALLNQYSGHIGDLLKGENLTHLRRDSGEA